MKIWSEHLLSRVSFCWRDELLFMTLLHCPVGAHFNLNVQNIFRAFETTQEVIQYVYSGWTSFFHLRDRYGPNLAACFLRRHGHRRSCREALGVDKIFIIYG